MMRDTYPIAAEVVREQYDTTRNDNPYLILENALLEEFSPTDVMSLMQSAAQKAFDIAEKEAIARVKTALRRLADRVEFDDENTIVVPVSEILMYTDQNRTNIARMLRREADAL